MLSKLTALAGALALAFVLAACGSGDDGGSTVSIGTGPPLTPEAFVVQGDAICAVEEAKVNAQRKRSAQTDPAKFQVNVVVPSVEARIAALSQLSPPPERADEFRELLDTAQEAVDNVKEDPSALSGDESPFAETQEKALALGLRECAD